nr:MAG TPA: hypothetical protein [Caudoviricetes sp.]
MRRMISQKLQDLLRKLSKSIWADDNGNVEVGKNLEVDGEATINTHLTSVDNAFNRVTIPTFNAIRTPNDSGGFTQLGKFIDDTYSKAKYHHLITIMGADTTGDLNSDVTIGVDLSKNTPIDSVQDLTTMLGGAKYLCTGTMKYSQTVAGTPLKIISVGNTIADTQVYTFPDESYSFSDCFASIDIFTDDVSIPR